MNNARRAHVSRALAMPIDASVCNLFRVRCRWDETVTSRYPYGDMTFTEANDTLWKDVFIKYTKNANIFRDDVACDNT